MQNEKLHGIAQLISIVIHPKSRQLYTSVRKALIDVGSQVLLASSDLQKISATQKVEEDASWLVGYDSQFGDIFCCTSTNCAYRSAQKPNMGNEVHLSQTRKSFNTEFFSCSQHNTPCYQSLRSDSSIIFITLLLAKAIVVHFLQTWLTMFFTVVATVLYLIDTAKQVHIFYRNL